MLLELHYKGTKSYGTGSNTKRYAAKLNGDGDSMKLKFLFPNPPSGLTDSWYSDARVKGFDLSLSRSEAVQIATALLAFAHHPTAWQEEARWMPLDEMPKLEVSEWKKSVKLATIDGQPRQYQVTNNTAYHIGKVTLEFTYTDAKTDEEQKFLVIYTIDLAPKQSRRISVDHGDTPKGIRVWQITISQAVITEVTGFNLASI
jgi:hypothetical protein